MRALGNSGSRSAGLSSKASPVFGLCISLPGHCSLPLRLGVPESPIVEQQQARSNRNRRRCGVWGSVFLARTSTQRRSADVGGVLCGGHIVAALCSCVL